MRGCQPSTSLLYVAYDGSDFQSVLRRVANGARCVARPRRQSHFAVLALTLAVGLGATASAAPPQGSWAANPNPELEGSLMSGAWVHRVPLELPPGRAELVPQIGLAANHQVPDGSLGSGWMLEDLSRIERRGPTRGVPRFSLDEPDWF